MRHRFGKWLAPAFLLLAVLVFYRSVLFSKNQFIPFDLPGYHLPLAAFQAQCVRNGWLPLWDPSVYCGRPLAANIQAQTFYPFRMLTVLIGRRASNVNLLRLLEIELIIHVFLGGLFTLFLAKHLFGSRIVALFSATTFSLGCYFASQAQHIGAIEAACWMPLGWLAILLIAEKWSWRAFALLAVETALVLLSGFTPLAIVIVLSNAVLALGLVATREAGLKLLLSAGAASVCGILLCAIQILPTLQLSLASIGRLRPEWRGTGGGLPFAALASLVWPDYFHIFELPKYTLKWDFTLMYTYCGAAGLALAVLAIFHRPSRRKLPLLFLFIVSAIWMAGDNTVVGRFLYASMPRFVAGAFYPAQWLAPFSLSLALLAGFGLAQYSSLRRFAAALVLLAACDLILAGSNRPMNTRYGDDASIGMDVALDGDRKALADLRRMTASTVPPLRIDIGDDSLAWLADASLTRVPTANGYDPLALTRTIQARLGLSGGSMAHCTPVQDPSRPILSFLNIGYLLRRTPLPADVLAHTSMISIGQYPGRYIYANRAVMPRFFLVGSVQTVRSADEAASIVRRRDWDPRSLAVVEGLPGPPEHRFAGGEVAVREYSPNRVALETESAGVAYLVSSETEYPGWRGSVDGHATPIYYTNVAFRGIVVPAGKHRVAFEYKPGVLLYAALLSAVTLLGLMYVVIGEEKRRRPAAR